jgi:hypothetical protein
MPAFQPFFADLFAHHLSWIGGLLTAMSLIEKIGGKPLNVSRRTLLWSGIALLFVSCCQAWFDEHANVVNLIRDKANLAAQLDQLSKPKLAPAVEWAGSGDMPGLNATPIIMALSISNTGAQSIVRNWGLTVVLPSGDSVDAVPYLLPKVITINGDQGPRKLYSEDAIYNKTINPIPTGGEQTGIIMFTLTKFTSTQVKQAGTKFILKFDDVIGTHYFCQSIMKASTVRGIPGYVPGLKTP